MFLFLFAFALCFFKFLYKAKLTQGDEKQENFK